MNMTTIFRNGLLFSALFVLLVGCHDEDNFLAENTERTGEKAPVVSNLSLESAQDTLAVGETARLDLRFWSEGTVASINLYDSLVVDGSGVRAQQQVTSIDPSNAAFSEESQTDSLIIEYTVPSEVSDTTFIDLDVEVVNDNGLRETNETANTPAIEGFGIVGVQ